MPTIKLIDGPHLKGETINASHPERVVPYLEAIQALPETPQRITTISIGRGTGNRMQIVGDDQVHRTAEAHIRHSGREGDGWWLMATPIGTVTCAEPDSDEFFPLTEADGGVRLRDQVRFMIHEHVFVYSADGERPADDTARRVVERNFDTVDRDLRENMTPTKPSST